MRAKGEPNTPGRRVPPRASVRMMWKREVGGLDCSEGRFNAGAANRTENGKARGPVTNGGITLGVSPFVLYVTLGITGFSPVRVLCGSWRGLRGSVVIGRIYTESQHPLAPIEILPLGRQTKFFFNRRSFDRYFRFNGSLYMAPALR